MNRYLDKQTYAIPFEKTYCRQWYSNYGAETMVWYSNLGHIVHQLWHYGTATMAPKLWCSEHVPNRHQFFFVLFEELAYRFLLHRR